MIATSSESFTKFNYLLRPSKQVERKLLIETLHHLTAAGYPIYKYTYLGLGSIYYADFMLFHKYLYINKMMCVEQSKIPNRMKFNKPFKFIKLKMKPVSEVISQLGRKTKYLAWLDYDKPLNARKLEDLDGFSQVLAPGSVLLATVDAEARHVMEAEDGLQEKTDEGLLTYLNESFSHLLVEDIKKSDLSRNDFPRLLSKIIRAQLDKSLSSRPPLKFHQLFNFVYADGAQMITIGGVIDDEGAAARIEDSGVFALGYVRQDNDLVRISVPPLTIREKQWIDSNLDEQLSAKKLDIDDELLAHYIEFYRHYHTYYETLL
jgi:hypothetical protein